ncbi:MAG: tetratricopeptide repeat protein [Nitrospira sp.]|nr:tetratricopeptide repeat protein [Nitrospira sp.]
MNINEALQLALRKYQAGDLSLAATIYLEIIKFQPDNVNALLMLGITYVKLRNYDAAINCFNEAIKINPSFTEAYYNLGNALRDKKQFDDALTCYQKVLQLNPGYADAYVNLGIINRTKGLFSEEIICYQKAIEINPNSIEAYYNLGNALLDNEQFNDAAVCYQYVLQINPNIIQVYIYLGLILRITGRLNEALTCYKKVIQLNPNYAEAHWQMANILLLMGDFRHGWKEYEWLWKTEDYENRKRSFSQPSWHGQDIKGLTILLYAEYGFGDTIQFIRYAPLVAQLGATVIVECQKELTSLLKSVEGIQNVISHGETLPGFDIHCSLMRLPIIFDTALENIPANIPYMTANPALVEKWRNRILHDDSKLKIGLVWAGISMPRKYCSLEAFAPFAQLKDITFYSLQKGKNKDQLKYPPKDIKLIDYTEEFYDFSDTAAFIENLDLVISIDTSVVHLAGAMGKPVWTLIPFVPDWRWFLNREDSPWYPTMRLFRQPALEDWVSVIAKILDKL